MLSRPLTLLLYMNLLFALLSLALVGCHATGTAASNHEPAFSKLAGRWWIPLRDLLEGEREGRLLPEEIESTEDERLLLAAVLADGSFDWSRTRVGVRHGIHHVRDPGDRCVAHKPVQSTVEVVASEYTPVASRIEMHIVDPGFGHDGSEFRLNLELLLNPDGTASCVETYIDQGLSSPLSFKLHRAAEGDPSIQNKSRISGRWSGKQPNAKLLLIIRADGTFDWSSTAAGMLGCWWQLEQQGDHSPNLSDLHKGYEVVTSRYTSTESSLKVRLYDRAPTPEPHETTIELVAERVNNKSIRVLLHTDAGGRGSQTHAETLYRDDNTQLREFYALRVFRELSGSDGPAE